LLKVLKRTELFRGIGDDDLRSLLDCLSARVQTYEKGEYIFLAGETKPLLGIVLSGNSVIVRENFNGGKTVIGRAGPPELFGETFACMGLKTVGVSVIAESRSEILFLDLKSVVGTCENACERHRLLISNLLKIIAEKNAALNKKIYYMSHRTIRERLLAYFEDMAESSGSRSFTVPFGRSALADYLCADRSAMSRELGKMKKEGLIGTDKNTVTLLG
jgi:CRP-like cAMP-binding protein